jgi:Tfp pilus assembly protein PilF
VRIAAAKAMLGTSPSGASEAARASLAAATEEWRASLLSRADFPETHLQIGGAALGARNVEVADNAFREAVTLDPQLVDAWAMIARIHAATGDRAGARRALGEGLAANPGAPLLESLLAELGP